MDLRSRGESTGVRWSAWALLVAAPLLSAPSHAQPARTPQTAFEHVNVLPMTADTVLRDHTVLVRDGAIVRVEPSRSATVPAGATRIDGRGKFLMPGLVDFHVHLRHENELRSYLAHGVTTVIQMSGPSAGIGDISTLKRSIAEGRVVGPRVFASGTMLDGSPPIFPNVSTVVETPEAAVREVARQRQTGVDFIKVYNNLAPDVHAAAVREAHRLGLAVFGHIPRIAERPRALHRAIEAGQDGIAHAEEMFFTAFYGATDSLLALGQLPRPLVSRIPEVVALLRMAGTVVIANLSFVAMTRAQLDSGASVFANPEWKYLSPDVRRMWGTQTPARRPDLARFSLRERAKAEFLTRDLVPALRAANVPILLGTDASVAGLYPGLSALVELRELVRAGLTPFEALATGTRVPGTVIARRFPLAPRLGTIEPNAAADLVLLDGDPRSDVGTFASTITGVMAAGRWRTLADLARLRDAEAVPEDRRE